MTVLIILGILAAGLIVYLIITYNSLVGLKARVAESWSGIDVQLKRRSSLIPNLVETVKGYAGHEKDVLTQVTEARAALVQAGSPKEKAEADTMLTGALKSLFAVSEAYPDLKANENFMSLQRDLTDTEDKIAYARQYYNGNVREFNVKIQVFPNVIIANSLGFQPAEFFEAEADSRQDISVNFGSDQPTAS
jgi:LemA protein